MASLRAGVFCVLFALCVWDLAQSASITKVNSLELPGGEKISKREAPDQPPQTAVLQDAAKRKEEKEKKDGQEKRDEQEKNVGQRKPFGVEDSSEEHSKDSSKSSEKDDSHPIYKSVGHEQPTRHRRSAPSKAEEAEDLDTAANTVFLPHFRKHFRPANRFRRDVNDEAIENYVSDQGEGSRRRFVREAQNQADDLDTAANTVFLPQFRKRFRPIRQF